MENEFIKEAKNFKRQMKWCSIMCWITTFILSYKAFNQIGDWGIVIIGGIVFTIIYFKMRKQIRDYEQQNLNTNYK